MELQNRLLDLSSKVESVKDLVTTEEATKNAFVLPMLLALGYDVYNPAEVIPEMDCDIANKGDKVDYAINIDGKPTFILECKQCSKNLDTFMFQLSKYYVASRARIAILTNGIQYRFYSDFDRTNLMDPKPFFIFDLGHYTDEDVELLGKFSKSAYIENEVLYFFKNRLIVNKVKSFIEEQVANPQSSLVDYVSYCIGDNVSADQLKEAIQIYLKSYIESGTEISDTNITEEEQQTLILKGEEYKVYLAVKDILSEYVDEDEIKYTAFKSYFTVNKWGSVWRWIVRFKRNSKGMSICFPLDDYARNEWVKIESVDDLYNMKERIKNSLKMASFPTSKIDEIKCKKTANTPQKENT